MTKILIDRATVEQALDALTPWADSGHTVQHAAYHALRAALAEPTLQTCNCRWDGEVQVQQCTLHEAHVDAIHEWAGRAKVAEKKLAALAEPVQEQAEPDSPERRCGGPGCDLKCCQPVEEPVAWMSKADIENPSGWRTVFLHTSAMATENSVPLYTSPPQRPAEPQGCDHCNHPLYAAIKCKVCGRVTEEWSHINGTSDTKWHPPQRKPLTEDEIFAIENDIPDDVVSDRDWTIWFARAVERAHGIKE